MTSETAIDEIKADTKKTAEARAEDIEFVERLRRNDVVRFGARDWSQQRRFDRTAKRETQQLRREEKEAERRKVKGQGKS